MSSDPTTLTVVLVHPSPLMRSVVVAGLAHAQDLRVLAVAETAGAARLAAGAGASLLLVDVSLVCDVEGLCLDAGTGGLPVVLLAAPEDIDLVLRGLESGASGVVLTDGGAAEAAGQLRRAAAGETAVPERLFGSLLKGLVHRRREESRAVSRLGRLSGRERQVLQLLVAGHDLDAVAASLVISPATARTHIAHVLTKLEVHSRLEAVALAVDLGLEPAETVEGRR